MTPMKTKKPCTYTGCKALITDGGRCEEHKRKERKRYDTERGNSGVRGYDSVWQRVRSLKLANDPLCERCERAVVAVLVHHKEPVDKRPDLRLVMSNLESLCQPCHEAEHKGERWGR